MKTRKSQNDDAPSIDSFVKNAPRFWLGAAALKQHVVAAANAFLEAVPERFTADGAKKAGEDDGLFAEGTVFSFQNACQAAYDKASLDAGSTIGKIVAHEGERIQRTIAGDFPDMEQELQRRVNLPWAVNHLGCAKRLGQQERQQKKFLRERELSVDVPLTTHGDYAWKFWLPLSVLVILEFSFNYLLLGDADQRIKIEIALASVAVVLGSGFAVSWFLKASQSVVRRNNQLAIVKKILCWLGVALICCSFALALMWLVNFRIGDSGQESGSQLEKMIHFFSQKPLDFILALFNILFFGVTIVTFNKAGWPLHGYGKVHEQLQSAKDAFYSSSNAVNDAARTVFDVAHKNVKQRLEDVHTMLPRWESMGNVVAEIPNITQSINITIDARYNNAIEIYRNAFAEARGGSADADLVHSPIPPEIREGAPIVSLNAINQPDIINLDRYREQAETFAQTANDWTRANSDLEKLLNLSVELKSQLMDSVKKSKKEDLLVAEEPDDTSDER